MTRNNKVLLVIGLGWLAVGIAWAFSEENLIATACLLLGAGFVAYALSQLREEGSSDEAHRTH